MQDGFNYPSLIIAKSFLNVRNYCDTRKELLILNYRRRNNMVGSVRSIRTNRLDRTCITVETKKAETEGRNRDRTDVNDKKNEMQGSSQSKTSKLLETKEQNLA